MGRRQRRAVIRPGSSSYLSGADPGIRKAEWTAVLERGDTD